MIRRANEPDFQALIRIWEDAVSQTHDFLLPEDFLEIRSKLPEYFKAVSLYVLEEEGDIEGFLGIDGGKIEMLFVGDRGKGIGGELLSFAIDSLNCTAVDVNTQNTQALHFYLKNGFAVSGSSPLDNEGKPYPITHLTLKK